MTNLSDQTPDIYSATFTVPDISTVTTGTGTKGLIFTFML